MQTHIFLVKAFTKDPAQGNPAGVILNADALTEAQMITISARLGFSESAFISQSNKADVRVRFFTPKEEVPLCGHATIAAAHILKQEGMVESTYTQETGAGILPITIEMDGKIFMKQNTPTFFEPKKDRENIARLLGLTVTDFLQHPIQSVSTGGAPKLIIPVKSLAILRSIKPDLSGIAEYDHSNEGRGFYPFTSEVMEAGSDFHARQFNPLIGIAEDPITGIAAGALGCYVQKHGLSPKTQLVIEQGYILNKGGKMYVNLEDGVSVGGYGVEYGREVNEWS